MITGFTTIEMLSVRPTYSASAVVEVRKENAPLIIAGGETDVDSALSLNTKILMFKSRPLLEDVINRLKLDQNPTFRDVAQKRSWWDTIKGLVGGDAGGDASRDHRSRVRSSTRRQRPEGGTKRQLKPIATRLVFPLADPRLIQRSAFF